MRAPCRRTRDGIHVSIVVMVPARHSAPATDAPQMAAPTTRKSAAVVSKSSPLPDVHQFTMRAGCAWSWANLTGSLLDKKMMSPAIALNMTAITIIHRTSRR